MQYYEDEHDVASFLASLPMAYDFFVSFSSNAELLKTAYWPPAQSSPASFRA